MPPILVIIGGQPFYSVRKNPDRKLLKPQKRTLGLLSVAALCSRPLGHVNLCPLSGFEHWTLNVSNVSNCVEKLPRDCLRMDFRKQ